MSGVLAPWVVAIALVTYRSVAGQGIPDKPLGTALPLPSEYVSTVVVFGTLGVLDSAAPQGSTLWGLIGWGFDLAIFLRLFGTLGAGASSTGSGGGLPPGAQALITQQQQQGAGLGATPAGVVGATQNQGGGF